MLVCNDCSAIEQGTKWIIENPYDDYYEGCAVCGSDDIQEYSEDDPNDDR